MTEVTANGLRADITRAYAEYTTELTDQGPNWEKKPAGGTEGEAAWCAREVAEHLAGACGFFAPRIWHPLTPMARSAMRGRSRRLRMGAEHWGDGTDRNVREGQG